MIIGGVFWKRDTTFDDGYIQSGMCSYVASTFESNGSINQYNNQMHQNQIVWSPQGNRINYTSVFEQTEAPASGTNDSFMQRVYSDRRAYYTRIYTGLRDYYIRKGMNDAARQLDSSIEQIGQSELQARATKKLLKGSDAPASWVDTVAKALGLLPLPSPGDQSPLLPKTKGTGAITNTSYIRKIVQSCFDQATKALIRDGFTLEAEALTEATVNWLRHTGISDDVKHRPREHVRDDAGAITDRYIDVELRERHKTAKAKMIEN